jgi:hypothetical protein
MYVAAVVPPVQGDLDGPLCWLGGATPRSPPQGWLGGTLSRLILRMVALPHLVLLSLPWGADARRSSEGEAEAA